MKVLFAMICMLSSNALAESPSGALKGDMTSAGEIRIGVDYSCIIPQTTGFTKLLLTRELSYAGTPIQARPTRLVLWKPPMNFSRFFVLKQVVETSSKIEARLNLYDNEHSVHGTVGTVSIERDSGYLELDSADYNLSFFLEGCQKHSHLTP